MTLGITPLKRVFDNYWYYGGEGSLLGGGAAL